MTPADTIMHRIQEALTGDGFKPRMPGILTMAIGDDVAGWVGLNVTSRRGPVSANVVVGVRSERLERFICRLAGKSIFGRYAPTIATHIGYLTPERSFHPWIFDGEPRCDEIDAIVTSVRDFGVPFMKNNASLDILAERLLDPTIAPHHQAIYRLPACHVILGNRARASELCAQFLEELENRHDAAADDYRRFVAELRSLYLRDV